ncbi:MAG: hypothetical protein IH596_07375 [Bacteroidales bacterium]|nr:hypothetical protein [Bacteroidales bacterium]
MKPLQIRSSYYIIFFLLLLLFTSQKILSQDNHYWSQQFGAKSTLLGGSVIGGVRDNSAIFYNPGAFAFFEYPSLSVNANLYQLNKLLIKDGAGQGVNLNSARLSIFPQIISGMMTLRKRPEISLSYCLMTRHYDNIFIKTRFTDRDFTSNNPDVETYIGEFDYTNQMNEQWFGMAASYKVNEKLGVGITFFGNYRAQTYQQTESRRTVLLADSASLIISFNDEQFIKYWTISGLFKIGLAYQTGAWKLGFTVTTPSFGIADRANLHHEFSSYAISDDPTDSTFTFITQDRVPKSKIRYKRPVSIGAGAEYTGSKTSVSLSAEFFSGIRQYDMIAPEGDPLIYPPEYEDIPIIREFANSLLLVERTVRPVFNVAVGMEQKLFPSLSLLAGFRTDFSNYKESDFEFMFANRSGSWDIYHCSLGLSVHRKKQIVTLGLTYSFSPKFSIDSYASINPHQTNGIDAGVNSQTFAISIGYTYLFPRE